MGSTIETVRDLARALPGVEESGTAGTLAFRVRGKLMAWFRGDTEVLAVKASPVNRDYLLQAEPDTFLLTEHYRNYPIVLVRLRRIGRGRLAEVLEEAWLQVATRRMREAHDANRKQGPGQHARFLAVLCFASSLACGAAPATPEEHAREFFERYTRLERRYDPAVVELYADAAEIRKSRKLPDGQLQHGVMSGAEFKRQIRDWIPGAAARGARNEYRNVRYQDLGNGFVRITSERHQLPQGFTFPQELVVGPDSQGRWLVWEDRTEAPPVTAGPR